ncbi:unnamed protein product [Linum trigynum]|uniref:Uncharacterized protein n=1 Tax=Linum trigynum TaxID=586398 RepID=A0AAV2G8Y6_9ROSI
MCTTFSKLSFCYHTKGEEEEEEEEAVYHEDIVEQTKVITENSRDDNYQECPVGADLSFLDSHSEKMGMDVEMQANLIGNLAWRLDLQSLLEDEEFWVIREVVEEEERNEEQVLDLSQGEKPNSEEGRMVEEATEFQ